MVDFDRVERKLTGWTESEWEGCRENYAEYKGSLGSEATKTFREFAFGIAAQNVLFEMISNGEVSLNG